MSDAGKDYRVDFRVRNARIVRKMEARGWCNADLARATGLGAPEVGRLVNLKQAPLARDGSIKRAAMLLCAALGASVDELWPEQHMQDPMLRNRASFEASLEDIRALTGVGVDYLEDQTIQRDMVAKALSVMTPRERRVISRHFGLDGKGEATLREIGGEIETSGGRVLQIENKAIRKARGLFHRLDGMDKALETTREINEGMGLRSRDGVRRRG